MSPYLSAIGMNILSGLLSKVPDNFNFHWKCKSMKLTQLFFADDVMVFSHGDKNSISHIMKCLSLYSDYSGLTPSLHKSTVFFSNCNEDVITWFGNEFGIPQCKLPVGFLGVPLYPSS